MAEDTENTLVSNEDVENIDVKETAKNIEAEMNTTNTAAQDNAKDSATQDKKKKDEANQPIASPSLWSRIFDSKLKKAAMAAGGGMMALAIALFVLTGGVGPVVFYTGLVLGAGMFLAAGGGALFFNLAKEVFNGLKKLVGNFFSKDDKGDTLPTIANDQGKESNPEPSQENLEQLMKDKVHDFSTEDQEIINDISQTSLEDSDTKVNQINNINENSIPNNSQQKSNGAHR